MSCRPIRASCALLTGPELVHVEVVVYCLLIAQHAQVLEWESWFVLHVQLLAGPEARRASLWGPNVALTYDDMQPNHVEVRVEVVCRSMKRSRTAHR
jgi:hypothetical protein